MKKYEQELNDFYAIDDEDVGDFFGIDEDQEIEQYYEQVMSREDDEMYREQKYKIELRKNITEEMLMEHGFIIEKTRLFRWAVFNKDDEGKMLILKLEPPEKMLMFRYQASEDKYDLLEEVENNGLKKLFKIKQLKK